MSPRLARLLVRLYPRKWRDRYGEEFEALLLAEAGTLPNLANVAGAAVRERIVPSQKANEPVWSFSDVATRVSAFLPVVMSLTALTVVLCHIAIYGAAREADEGAAAHIWQILMAGQLPVLAFFAIRWLPRAPKFSLYVLAAQGGAALASVAPVFLLNL